MKNAGFDPSFSSYHNPKTMQLDVIQPAKNIVGHSWHETGAAFGIEVRDPSMDLRVLEFCLSIPDRVFINNGNDRMLIKNAMKGILPPDFLENKKRGLQAADIQFRIGEDMENWEETLNTLANNKACNQIIDIQKLNAVLNNLQNEEKQAMQNTIMLTRGVMAGYWVSKNV